MLNKNICEPTIIITTILYILTYSLAMRKCVGWICDVFKRFCMCFRVWCAPIFRENARVLLSFTTVVAFANARRGCLYTLWSTCLTKARVVAGRPTHAANKHTTDKHSAHQHTNTHHTAKYIWKLRALGKRAAVAPRALVIRSDLLNIDQLIDHTYTFSTECRVAFRLAQTAHAREKLSKWIIIT